MKCLLSVFVLFISVLGYSQNYLSKIAKESCDCTAKLDDVTSETGQMQFGVCMMQASMPYKKQLLKDHGIDLNKLGSDTDDASRLGEVVALEMVNTCPETILKLASIADEDEVLEEEALETHKISGVVKTINQGDFVSVVLTEDNGNKSTYYWLGNIKSDVSIETNPKATIGKEVVIKYTKKEFYDYKSKSYKSKRVITEINKK